MKVGETVEVAFRPFTWDDLPAVVDIVNHCDVIDGLERGTSESELRSWWTSPEIDPEAGGFIVTVGGVPVGYGLTWLRKGNQRSGFSEFITDGIVLPEWRRRGIGTRIMAECERRARARLVEVPMTPVYFRTWNDVRKADAVGLCERLGMRPVRYFFDMVYDRPEPPADPAYPPGYSVRTFVRGQDEETSWRVYNLSFRDHWGHVDMPLEEWLHWVNDKYFAPDMSYLGLDPSGEVVGMCLCNIFSEENERVGREQGWVDTLGVVREHRRIGMGRALLLEGMGVLRRRGCTHLVLGVDTENPNGALRLYKSVGFRVNREEVAHRKTLQQ